MSGKDDDIAGAELMPPFSVREHDEPGAPFVFNSPHSGRIYPKSFLQASRLDPLTLRKSEDALVDELFAPVVKLGAPLMLAHFPRAYLDVNREPFELDPALIADQLPPYANSQTVRVIGGLGTVARVVADQEEIYSEPLKLETVLWRIHRLYKPYHARLQQLIDARKQKFGSSVLIDCHSMPSNPSGDRSGERPDFVIGDRFGTSCGPELSRFVVSQLRAMGYVVAKNKPYAGGYITEHYGRPGRGLHALQIEVNRALYLDETTFERNPNFAAVQRDLMSLASSLIENSSELVEIPRWAAE